MIVTDSLTDCLIETGDWQFHMFDSSRTTPLVIYLVRIFVWSVWSVWSVFQLSVAHLWTDFQSCYLLLLIDSATKAISDCQSARNINIHIGRKNTNNIYNK